jgi:hypothetical protein
MAQIVVPEHLLQYGTYYNTDNVPVFNIPFIMFWGTVCAGLFINRDQHMITNFFSKAVVGTATGRGTVPAGFQKYRKIN